MEEHSLEEKVDLENLVLIPSISYSNEGSMEYSYEIKEEHNIKVDNSDHTEIKKDTIKSADDQKNDSIEFPTDKNEICQICGLEFGSNAILKIHNSSVHPNENKVETQILNKSSKTDCKMEPNVQERILDESVLKNPLDTSKLIGTPGLKPFKCNSCAYKTANKSDLKRHINSIHEGIKPIKCSICTFETWNKTNLKIHIYSVY